MIRVEGHTHIGGLYDILLTIVDRAGILGWAQTLKDAAVPARAGDRTGMTTDDTPQLLARRPFLYSSLQTQNISFAGRVVSTRGTSTPPSRHALARDLCTRLHPSLTAVTISGPSDRRQVVHQQLELSGWMLPCAVKEQCEALALLSAIHHYKSSTEDQLEREKAPKAQRSRSRSSMYRGNFKADQDSVAIAKACDMYVGWMVAPLKLRPEGVSCAVVLSCAGRTR